MDKIIIEGGRALSGTVRVSGAKNAVLPILTATILAGGEHTITNVPDLKDVRTIKRLLIDFGAKISEDREKLVAETSRIDRFEAPYDLVRTMRASILVLGPLLGRLGRARVSLPGGCAIGARPINLHLMGMERLGAKIELKHGYVEATAKRLKGAEINLELPTVTGTENIMMAAAVAEGTSTILNAAREPEVEDLAIFLNSMGAKIEGAGTATINIEGVSSLTPGTHSVVPDRIETGTFMAAAAITRGDIIIKGAHIDHLAAVARKFEAAGVKIEPHGDDIRVMGPERPSPVDIDTMPYPGFPTDMQAQFMALLSLADGSSVITERIFENRFMHVGELKRMGADIKLMGNTALIRGVKELGAAPVMATDLRASASLVLAALAAKGASEVHRVYHLDRGYESLERKLGGLGAKIQRVPS